MRQPALDQRGSLQGPVHGGGEGADVDLRGPPQRQPCPAAASWQRQLHCHKGHLPSQQLHLPGVGAATPHSNLSHNSEASLSEGTSLNNAPKSAPNGASSSTPNSAPYIAPDCALHIGPNSALVLSPHHPPHPAPHPAPHAPAPRSFLEPPHIISKPMRQGGVEGAAWERPSTPPCRVPRPPSCGSPQRVMGSLAMGHGTPQRGSCSFSCAPWGR